MKMRFHGIHLRFQQWAMTALILLSSSAFCRAVDLSADVYYDKLRGAKVAEEIGNLSGLPTEGQHVTTANSAGSVAWVLLQTWDTDDDTSCEWTFLHMMETNGLDLIDYRQIAAEWRDHFQTAVWCANLTAYNLIGAGHLPPSTGSQALNAYWNNMTRQFEGEIFGQISPGMPLATKTRAEWWGKVTNEGNAVDTGSFISLMCEDAFFTSDPVLLIEHAKAYYPTSSLTCQMAADVQNWHAQNSNDWRWCRDQVQSKYFLYNPCPTDWNGCEVNFCSKLIALLYGNGDFKNTLQIACLAGWDCDCDMATVGAIMGTICGYSGIPADLRDACGDVYHNTNRANLPAWDSLSNIASREQVLGEENIVARGGTITGTGTNKTYHIVDGEVDQLPFAQSQSLSLMQDTSLGIMLRAMDPYLATLTYTVTVSVAHGTLTGNSTNKLYTPFAGYYGPDSFVFKVNNGSNDSNEATISILVMRVNHPPVANNSSVTTTEDTARPITLVATDVDGDALTFTWTQPGHGSVAGDGSSNVVYTPTLYWQGTDSFSFVADDGYLGLATGQVTVVVAHTNHVPVAENQNVSVLTNKQRAITLTATDADGDTITGYNVTVLPSHGTLGGSGADRTYTPFASYLGPDGFKFTASDGQTTSAEATVTITVTDVSPVQKMKIAFGGYNKGEALTNFPALVVFSNAMSAGFAYADFASTNGYDLRFKDATETQELNYEQDKWNPAGNSYVWVQVPVLTNNAYIWAYWGDPSLTTPPACTTNGATWTANYLGVWHMNETNAAGKVADSTSFKRLGSNVGSANTAGLIGSARSFDGVSARVEVPDAAELRFTASSSYEVSAWVYLSSTPNNAWKGLVTKSRDASPWYGLWESSASPDNWYFTSGSSSITGPGVQTGWHYLAGIQDAGGNKTRLYVDGVQVGTPGTAGTANGSGDLWFGGAKSQSEYFSGSLDEIRVGNMARSSNWVWACYMTVGSNPAFTSYGAVQSESAAILRIFQVVSAGSAGCCFSWSGAAGAANNFNVYRSTNLLAGSWQLVAPDIARSGTGTNAWTDTNLFPQAFYRVATPN